MKDEWGEDTETGKRQQGDGKDYEEKRREHDINFCGFTYPFSIHIQLCKT